MLRERIKDMELRLTELAGYLQISRPTLYKFIELYDLEEREEINPKVLKLFDYICSNSLIGKKTVIAYILTNLTDVKPLGEKSELAALAKAKKYILANPETDKTMLLEFLCTTEHLDEILPFLLEVAKIKAKKRRTEAEKAKILIYEQMIEKIKDNEGDN